MRGDAKYQIVIFTFILIKSVALWWRFSFVFSFPGWRWIFALCYCFKICNALARPRDLLDFWWIFLHVCIHTFTWLHSAQPTCVCPNAYNKWFICRRLRRSLFISYKNSFICVDSTRSFSTSLFFLFHNLVSSTVFFRFLSQLFASFFLSKWRWMIALEHSPLSDVETRFDLTQKPCAHISNWHFEWKWKFLWIRSWFDKTFLFAKNRFSIEI